MELKEMETNPERDYEGHLELRGDPEEWIKNNLASLLKVESLKLVLDEEVEEIGESIGVLKNLIRLKFSGCASLKCVPNTITRLHNLKGLEFVDCGIEELPANLGQLKSLTHLSLSSCEKIKSFPDSIRDLCNLETLFIDNCKSLKQLPANLDGLSRLYLVDIHKSRIKCLPWSIVKLPELRHLILPEDFRLQTLPYELNNSVIISVKYRHVRKSWEELKTDMGLLPVSSVRELANAAAQNSSIISPPGYLRLKGDPSQWIINNTNLIMFVRILDLEDVEVLTDSITRFSALTNLYLYITDDVCLPDNYFVTLTGLRHLSLEFYGIVDIGMSFFHGLSKLSNLETLHLKLNNNELPANFNMPVSLKHLSLSYCNVSSLYDSLAKLSNLKTLDLNSCNDCNSLPPNMYPVKLKLINCPFKSLPIGLLHLEILFFNEAHFDDLYLSCVFEKWLNQLVNLETLSISCSEMEFLPEEIARLSSLQKLQLKDCVNLRELPSNLHELVNLRTLDISITNIKSLPPKFMKPPNLQHLILPRCFNLKSLPRNLKQVSIDDTDEIYYKRMNYDAFLNKTLVATSDKSRYKEAEQCVIPGDTRKEGNDIHEIDLFNSIYMGYLEHIPRKKGAFSPVYKDSHVYGSKDPVGEHSQQTAFSSQTQFTPLGNGEFTTSLPRTCSLGLHNQRIINDGQMGNMTFVNAHGIAPISQHLFSCDRNNFIGGLNNNHAIEFVHNNNNSQSYDADAARQEKEIISEAILEQLTTNMGLNDAADKLGDLTGYNSPKKMLVNINVMNRRLKYYCSMQSPPRGLGKAENLKISLCVFSKELLAKLKDSMSLQYLAIEDCSQHRVNTFPTNFSELANLKTLSIRCNYIESLPSFSGLSGLLKLYIGGGVRSLSPRLEKLPADLDRLDRLLVVDIHDTKIKCLPLSIKKLQKLRFLFLPLDFRLETLPSQLIESVIITVDSMHIRKTWKELKAELGLPSFHGVGVDAQSYSTISPSGYLQLKEDPGLWIMKNYDLCLSVRILELELRDNMLKKGDSLRELRNLTYLYISGSKFLNLKHLPDTSMTLRHLSLQNCNIESLPDSLRKLSNLESLCLDLGDSNLPDNLDLLVNLKHLSLHHGMEQSDFGNIAKLSNLKALDLFQCELESLPENLNLAELKLSGSNIRSLPTSLHRLEILHDKETCETTECDVTSLNLKRLINMEKLSVTCYAMELLPNIERLQYLQELQLKDCFSLEALPNDLGGLVKLCTLDISGTGIKSLPDGIKKLCNLKHLILPKCFQQNLSLKYSNGFTKVSVDDIVELYFNDMSDDDDDYETSMEICNEGNGIKLDPVEGHNEAISKELEKGITNAQSLPQKLHVTPIIGDFCSNRRGNSNPEGQSIPAIQDNIIAMETKQGYCENEQNQILRNDMKGKKRKEISLETLRSFWSKNMMLEEAAKEIGVSRSTLKRRMKDLHLVWPSSRKGEQHLDAKKRKLNNKAPSGIDCTQQDMVNPGNSVAHVESVEEFITGSDQQFAVSRSTLKRRLKDLKSVWPSSGKEEQHLDAKKRKHNNKAPFGIDCSQQNMMNPGNLSAHVENAEECITEPDQLMLPNNVSSKSNTVVNLTSNTTMETITENYSMETQGDIDHPQCAQEPLNTLSDTSQRNESSRKCIVKATYKDDIVRFVFPLTNSIDELKEEVASQLELDVNTFKIKYQDEDKDWILMTRISNLEHALDISRSSNNSNVVRLFIIPKT